MIGVEDHTIISQGSTVNVFSVCIVCYSVGAGSYLVGAGITVFKAVE